MSTKHLPTMFKFEDDSEFRTLKRNEWKIGEIRECYVGLLAGANKVVGQLKRTFVNAGGYLVDITNPNNKGSVENLSNGRGYFLITQGTKFTPQLQDNFIKQIEQQEQVKQQQRKNDACNFIQHCTNEQLTQIEQLISTLG